MSKNAIIPCMVVAGFVFGFQLRSAGVQFGDAWPLIALFGLSGMLGAIWMRR